MLQRVCPKDRDILLHNCGVMIQVKKNETDTVWSYPHPYSNFISCPSEVLYSCFPPVRGLTHEHAFCCPVSLVSCKLGEMFFFFVFEIFEESGAF